MPTEPRSDTLQQAQSKKVDTRCSSVFRSQQGPVSITIYRNSIPDFAEAVLERLYQNIYCTKKRLELYHGLENISTYVASNYLNIKTLLLFKISKQTAYVLNQQVFIPKEHISIFAQTIFDEYRHLRKIEFYALDVNDTSLPLEYPHQKIAKLEENIIPLPRNENDFLKLMSSQVRKKLLSSIRRTKEHNPSYRFEILTGEEISAEIVSAIVNLANERMVSKKLPPYIAEKEITILTQLACRYGYAGLIIIDGIIRGANLSFRIGERSFSRLIAHDPAYDEYSLGNQVQFLTILHCISTGGKEYWMSGGGSGHKAHFLAVRRELHNITVYRSKKAILFCSAGYLRTSIRKQIIYTKEKVRNKSLESNRVGNAILIALNIIRTSKAMLRSHRYSGRRAN